MCTCGRWGALGEGEEGEEGEKAHLGHTEVEHPQDVQVFIFVSCSFSFLLKEAGSYTKDEDEAS